MQIRMAFGLAAAAVLAATAVACGGGSSPTAPDGGPSSPGGVGATITITPAGVNPSSVTISAGQSVTFVNNDTQSHVMSSDPHPAHTDCPSLTVGSVGAGQTRTSGALSTARTCGYHDHDQPGDSRWRGQITIR